MSVINKYKDPMSGKETSFAKGSVKFISIKPVKNADPDGVKRTHVPAKNGQPAKVIEATHSISFLMQAVDDNDNVIDPAGQGEWIGMGEKKLHASHTDKIQVKFDSGYKDILPGMVVSFPLKISKNGDKTYVNGTLSGKVFTIRDESKAGTPAPRAQSSGSSTPAVAGSVKIYGEITALNGNIASVSDEKLGVGDVVLSDEQLAQVQVGGRLTALIVKETGAITGGFKAYGPAGQNSNPGGKGKGKYDPVGVSTGHALNVLANLRLLGYKGDLTEAGKISHDVTTKLIREFSDASGKDEGQSIGNAVKFAATGIAVKGKTIIAEELETSTREAYALAGALREYISANTQGVGDDAAQGVPEPLKQKPTNVVPPPVDFDPPLDDFDSDIPF